MSRTALCFVTAAVLTAVSLCVMGVRYRVLGDEVKVPATPGTWKVTLVVQGNGQGDARLTTAAPLDFGRQHVLREQYRSAELLDRPADAQHPDRRLVTWSRRSGLKDGPFRARCEFFCAVDVHRPTASMTKLLQQLYEAPQPGEHLDADSLATADREPITALARGLTAGLETPADQAEALYRHVEQELANEPTVGLRGLTAVECLRHRSGDSRAKSRLLAGLLHSRGIPARLVAGVALVKQSEQHAHYWVEAWVQGRWLPMSPSDHHYGRAPGICLVFGYGDLPIVRGKNVSGLQYAFLVERTAPEEVLPAADASPLRRLFRSLSLYMLPPAEQRLVEFLLLLPIAALVVCIFRNMVGILSFGTFAPALLGLAFRDLHSLPGIVVLVAILLIGWLLRRTLDQYHLLQVPRMAFMLSLVVLVLLVAIIAANFLDLSATRYIALFPMVILTGMIERFWTLEMEDGTAASFKTLLSTMLIAAAVGALLSMPAVATHMFRYPETLGLVMAGQLLIGRYTGYRLSELFRFRDFFREPVVEPAR